MKDIEKAKELLFKNDYTCVLCKGDTVYTSHSKGIAPILELLESQTDISGFCVADKIVGKAAAMLYSLGKVKQIFACVLIESAAEYLTLKKIPFSCITLTQKIINRQGTDICPMEKCVKNISCEKEALSALILKRDELRRQTK